MNVAYNQDCMEAMRAMPDGAFDLAVVDPIYGDSAGVETAKNQKPEADIGLGLEEL